MNIKTLAIATVAAAVSLTAVLPASQAQAGHRRDAAIAAGAGFFGGLIVGGVLSERHSHGHGHGHYYEALPAAHVQSCFDRYKSYDVATNTWVDYHYRTRICYSQYLY